MSTRIVNGELVFETYGEILSHMGVVRPTDKKMVTVYDDVFSIDAEEMDVFGMHIVSENEEGLGTVPGVSYEELTDQMDAAWDNTMSTLGGLAAVDMGLYVHMFNREFPETL